MTTKSNPVLHRPIGKLIDRLSDKSVSALTRWVAKWNTDHKEADRVKGDN